MKDRKEPASLSAVVHHQSPLANQPLPPGLEEEIRRRAYELYEERGRQDGYSLDDWVQAEAQVFARRFRAASAAA